MTGGPVAPSAAGGHVFALLGKPVSHSLSPLLHNAAFRAAGRPHVYVARAVDDDDCGDELRRLALAGGGGNVTVPHKERVVAFLDERTEAVDATGACNTFWGRQGVVWGDNTDVEGFLGSWAGTVGAPPRDATVLVLGAGGAARAVVHGLLSAGVRNVGLWNRTPARARALVAHFEDPRLTPVEDWRGLECQVLVNATSVGMDGASLPLRLQELDRIPVAVLDLVYREGGTPLVREARRAGAVATDGLDMLVRQAEASYRCWFGEPPQEGVMRLALDP